MNEHNTLTVIGEQELARLENKIRQGKDAFIEVGNALIEIRDGRGYTLRGYKTFEAYCEKVWGFSDRHARRLMSGAEVASTVKQISGETPANEAVAREFARVAQDPKQVERVVKKLKNNGGSVATATAEKVAAVVAQVQNKTASAPKASPAHIAPKAPPTFSDECPHHHGTPENYYKGRDGWHCGECDGAVFIGVVAASAQTKCGACGKSVTPGAPYCENCGGIL